MSTCLGCGHEIEFVPDVDEDGAPVPEGYGMWVRVDTGWDCCEPGPGDEDRYHEPTAREEES
jgi:hypothetical protein